jgi:flagellar hook protein FlgE
MSLFGAMTSGVSGLAAQSSAMGAIADNITNVNTVGYKNTKTDFQSLVTKQTSARSYSTGGVHARPLQLNDVQGLLQKTASQTDIGVSGAGYFVVNGSSRPSINSEFLFTRAGSFHQDNEGFLRNAAGFYLQGWPTDPQGNVMLPTGSSAGRTNENIISTDFLQTVNLSRVGGTASPTTRISIGANLPAHSDVGDGHEMDVQVFDSLGTPHGITFKYVKTGANEWGLEVEAPAGATAVTFYDGQGNPTTTPSITFGSDGLPAGFNVTKMSLSGFANGAADLSDIALNFGTIGEANGLTQFGADFSPTSVQQNGARYGEFSGVTIGADGLVTALFDNGEMRPIYKIPLATFANPNGLESRSGNVWTATQASGNPLLGAADQGPAGEITQSTLEASTVDIAKEFTDMIVVQRAYSAATKIISTADEMMEELGRLKR